MKISRLFLVLTGLLFGFCGHSMAYDITITPTSDGTSPQTDFACGNTIVLSVDLNNAPAEDKVAGVAFTIVYPDQVVDPPSLEADGLPSTDTELMSAFPFTTGTTKTYRAGNSVVGELALSGAEIDPSTGGATNHADDAQLFAVSFKVKSGVPLGDYQFGIQTTVLDNPAAGWNGESPPVMVGAVPNTDTANFNDLSGGAFPTLLSSINNTTSFSIVDCPDDTLDVDGNGSSDALTDGILIIRHLFNFTGTSLTDGAVDTTNCSRCDATSIISYLEAAGVELMDVDGNGVSDALTDGILIIRFLFNFTGASLTDGAVDTSNCTRCDSAAIEAFLNSKL